MVSIDRAAKLIKRRGPLELLSVRKKYRKLLLTTLIFSVFVNLLMLTGPLYMLQVYDRVLGSGSVETLLSLTIVMCFLYTMMGLLDFSRGRIMARVGAGFQATLDRRVFQAMLTRAGSGSGKSNSSASLSDLEAVQRFLSSPVLLSLFDLPWTPIFLFGIFMFHSWLGLLALGGGVLLIFVSIVNQYLSREPLVRSTTAQQSAQTQAEEIAGESEVVQGLGMREAAYFRWSQIRSEALDAQILASDLTGTFSTLTRTFRMLLQSAILGLGAYLVLKNEVTPGAMIASSILMGRALAPIDATVAQWPIVQRAHRGWKQLSELLGSVSNDHDRISLPRPKGNISVQDVTIVAPGSNTIVLRNISFNLAEGQAMGVIGPSGSGKSSLARVLTGVWPVNAGRISLGGASLDQYDPDILGSLIGYLPQRVQLFDGTIAQNIARLEQRPDSSAVVKAAKAAAVHDMILELPDGYDTQITTTSNRLSGGQAQRIGLARALYGNPVLLVLDEPNSNLDSTGTEALNIAIRTIKSQGGSIIIMAHRPAAIKECDVLLMLDNGRIRAFGPRDEVLRRVAKNYDRVQEKIKDTNSSGGIS